MADRDVVNGKGQANCDASPDREEISFPASLAPVNSRHAMILAMTRDYFPGLVPDKPRKHRITADVSSSGARNKRVRISVEPIREHFLDGRGISSDRPGNVHWQKEVSHGDVRKKSSQAPPRGRLPKGILKKGNRGKAKSVLKDDPTSVPKDDPTAGDFKDIEASLYDIRDIEPHVPLNDINVRHLGDPEFPRSSLASLGSWNMRLSDTSIESLDSKMLDGRYSDISVDAPDEDNKDTKVDGIGYLELLRRKMRQAASSEDFVRAGELQQEVRQLEELARDIKAATAKDDCILAGELQSQHGPGPMCHSRLTPGTLPIRDPEGMDTLLILTNTLLPSISPPISPFGWPATHSIPKIFALSRAPSLAEHQAGIMGCIRAFSRHLLNPVSNPIMHKAGMYGPSQKAQKMLGRSLVESQVRGKLDVCFKGAN
ncbi:hypothetical protein THAOC_04139, partial [Thalassiosira oceanica]